MFTRSLDPFSVSPLSPGALGGASGRQPREITSRTGAGDPCLLPAACCSRAHEACYPRGPRHRHQQPTSRPTEPTQLHPGQPRPGPPPQSQPQSVSTSGSGVISPAPFRPHLLLPRNTLSPDRSDRQATLQTDARTHASTSSAPPPCPPKRLSSPSATSFRTASLRAPSTKPQTYSSPSQKMAQMRPTCTHSNPAHFPQAHPQTRVPGSRPGTPGALRRS